MGKTLGEQISSAFTPQADKDDETVNFLDAKIDYAETAPSKLRGIPSLYGEKPASREDFKDEFAISSDSDEYSVDSEVESLVSENESSSVVHSDGDCSDSANVSSDSSSDTEMQVLEQKDNSEKREAVKNQLNRYDKLVDLRMSIQKCVSLSNEHEIPVTSEIKTVLTEVLDISCELGQKDIWRSLATSNKRILELSIDTLESWHKKIHFNDSKFKVINQGIRHQYIQQTKDLSKAILRTQKTQDAVVDPETFNDTDFYNQILRDFAEKRPKQIISIPKKQKKTVDTKASKGRKIRYSVHEKIQNFMTPVSKEIWTDHKIKDLYVSLFK